MIQATVKVQFSGLVKFADMVETGLNGTGDQNPVRVAFRQWAVRYRVFIQRRFDQYSRGGGDWAPLKEATVRARKKGKAGQAAKYRKLKNVKATSRAPSKSKGKKTSPEAKARRVGALILRNTGLLFAALNPTLNLTGGVEDQVPLGIVVGYGGPARHGDGRATIADIASYHNNGGPKLPQRIIIVEPDAETNKKMAGDMERALQKVAIDMIEKGLEL